MTSTRKASATCGASSLRIVGRTVLSYLLPPVAERLDVRGRMTAELTVASACSQFAPHTNVKGPQFRIRHPKVAQNRVFGDGSELILPVCDPK